MKELFKVTTSILIEGATLPLGKLSKIKLPKVL
jgi:hypothetical protein